MKKLKSRVLKSLTTVLFASAVCAAAQAQTQVTAPIKLAMIESLSGPFANTGEAVYRNLAWAVERVNARGGVKLPGGNRPLVIERYDNKGQNEEALSTLR
ncbi:MAG: ABC transporter substrate-binding protein, partial [Burkholderiaceae bacterium]|nr:ABC transporter substrate-binding protein [Burkholderiaceae bacterium]